MSLLAETKRRVIPATKFKLINYLFTYLFIYLFLFIYLIYFYLFIYLFITCTTTKILVVLFLSPAAEEGEDDDFGVSDDSYDIKERRFVKLHSIILYQSNWWPLQCEPTVT